MSLTNEARDIILELASKNTDLSDPKTLHLIQKLNSIANSVNVSFFENEISSDYYSVKDVAELFDVSKQTVYKWIEEEKIGYREDKSPGKQQRKGYLIPKIQFMDHEKIKDVDPTFFPRREIETEDIPNTDFGGSHVELPSDSNKKMTKDDIKQMISRK